MNLPGLTATLLTLFLAAPSGGGGALDEPSGERSVIVDREVIVDGDEIVSLREGDGDDPLVVRVGGRRGFLGVRLMGLTEDLRKHYGASEDAGILVSEVESESPAAKAGVQVGDVITDVEGDRVDSAADLARAVREKKTGDKLRLRVVRDRRAHDLTVTVEEREGRGLDLRGFRHPRGKAWTYRVDPESWKPQLLENLDDLPKLRDRLEDLEKRLKELEKRLSAR